MEFKKTEPEPFKKVDFLETVIKDSVAEKFDNEKALHVKSGKLAASRLGWPLQWQILDIFGVPGKEPDDYTKRKFIRGKQVEDWVIDFLPGLLVKQNEVEYMGVVGKIDGLIYSGGISVPVEIKSVTNRAYKHILTEGPHKSHALQACLYALAKGSPTAYLVYIASDDLRTTSFLLNTEMYKEEIDMIIKTFDSARTETIKHLQDHDVPDDFLVFVAKEPWQEKKDYQMYPDWVDLKGKKLLEKLNNYNATPKERVPGGVPPQGGGREGRGLTNNSRRRTPRTRQLQRGGVEGRTTTQSTIERRLGTIEPAIYQQSDNSLWDRIEVMDWQAGQIVDPALYHWGETSENSISIPPQSNDAGGSFGISNLPTRR